MVAICVKFVCGPPAFSPKENAGDRAGPHWIAMQSLEGANIDAVSQAVAAVRCSAPLDAHWKDAIEADFRKRQRKGRK